MERFMAGITSERFRLEGEACLLAAASTH
jgi:hypothetical protein